MRLGIFELEKFFILINIFKLYSNYDISITIYREGPALNICIEREDTRKKVPLMSSLVSGGDTAKILDADFTLALRCPKFPRDGKCK